ncbi:hypothetical protein BDV93DRAFT_604069 [Ceratobasidium sp. AG-I]|nr:hypothetical protein BDV93DRAFT_604069 [Ceratobasidium sp. AG-I]
MEGAPEHASDSCIFILVLGPSSSGKTLFVDPARRVTKMGKNEPMTEVDFHSRTIAGQTYGFVNTPDLDNPNLSDYEVFRKIKDCLVRNEVTKNPLTGVVYVHRPEDSLSSGTLYRNMRVISQAFLGPRWYPRLSIVVPGDPKTLDLEPMFETMCLPNSPFSDVLDGDATVYLGLTEGGLFHVLSPYCSMDPALLHIQSTHSDMLPDSIGDSIQRCLGHLDISSVDLRLRVQADAYQDETNELYSALQESQTTELALSKRLEATKVELFSYRDERNSLQLQFQQIRAEYASLRSQLQLQQNVEQGDIVRALRCLNREIEDIGRSFSAFLVDNHATRLSRNKSADLTTLHALHLDKLKLFLGHKERSPSLVASSHGQGLGIEDFFDYSIRSTLCKYLYDRVFSLFHPGAGGMDSLKLETMYNGIRRREPQAAAAKWRSTTFKSIYRHGDPDATSNFIKEITRITVQSGLNPLIDYVFGERAGVALKEQHFTRLERLVRTAWEWNIMLKGEVLMLGDFEQTNYEAGSYFDPQLMIEYEANSDGPAPQNILATLSLGLNSSRAVGEGRSPEVTNVCKAVVATELVLYG